MARAYDLLRWKLVAYDLQVAQAGLGLSRVSTGDSGVSGARRPSQTVACPWTKHVPPMNSASCPKFRNFLGSPRQTNETNRDCSLPSGTDGHVKT